MSSLSFAQCRALARDVAAADHGREAVRVFRPHTGVMPFRSRAPIAVSLYLADRDDLLVRGPAAGFVVLRPPPGPASRPIWADGPARGVVRLTDRHWEGVALFGPAIALLLLSASMVAIAVLVDANAVVLWTGLGAALSAMAWIALGMGLGLLAALIRTLRPHRSGLDRFAAETLPSTCWTAALTHVADPARARELVSLTRTQVRRYVHAVSRERAAEVDARITQVESTAAVLFLRCGITTQAGRETIAASLDEQLFPPGAEVYLVDSPDRGANRIPPAPSARFGLLFAVGVAVVLAFSALAVASAERTACAASSCAGRPASYPDALRFLLQRLWFSDPSDLAPATAEGVVLGWLFSLLGLTAIGVAVVSIILIWRKRAMLDRQLAERRRGMTPSPEVVILTALEAEFQAVVEHLTDIREQQFNGSLFEVGIYVGEHYVWTVAVVQVGSTGERAAVHAERAANAFAGSLTHLLFVGVAGGRKDVRLGDVVMADSVYDYQAGKDEADGFRPRFKTHHSSHDLVQRALAVARQGRWQQTIRPSAPQPPPNAYVKPIAAGSRVIANDRAETARLIAQNCGDAVAVETVSFDFLYAAHVNPGVSAGVVCGVSDLLSDKAGAHDAHWQPAAARHAAAFAFAMISGTRLR